MRRQYTQAPLDSPDTGAWGPHPHPHSHPHSGSGHQRAGVRGHPRQAVRSHPQRPQGWQVAVPEALGSQSSVAGARPAFCPDPVTPWGGRRAVWEGSGAEGGRSGGGGRGANPAAGEGASAEPRRPARRTHRTLAATEDMASLLSALLREAAAPMVAAAAHPPASERAPRPPPPPGEPHRAGAPARDPHGRTGPSASPAARGERGWGWGRRLRPPRRHGRAGLGGDPPPTTSCLGAAAGDVGARWVVRRELGRWLRHPGRSRRGWWEPEKLRLRLTWLQGPGPSGQGSPCPPETCGGCGPQG